MAVHPIAWLGMAGHAKQLHCITQHCMQSLWQYVNYTCNHYGNTLINNYTHAMLGMAWQRNSRRGITAHGMA
jgi:hypothetical protein